MKPGSQLCPGPNLNASNTYMRDKRSYKSMFTCRAMILLSWGCGGMAAVRWKDIGSLGRTDRRRRGAVALHVSDQLERRERHPGMDEQQPESSWVRIKGRAGAGCIIVGVWVRLPKRILSWWGPLQTNRGSLMFTSPYGGLQPPQYHIHLSVLEGKQRKA